MPWEQSNPHGRLVQHIHIWRRRGIGVWTEYIYTHRYPHGFEEAVRRLEQGGLAVAWRWCDRDDERSPRNRRRKENTHVPVER